MKKKLKVRGIDEGGGGKKHWEFIKFSVQVLRWACLC
jgi:hypothetical protein